MRNQGRGEGYDDYDNEAYWDGIDRRASNNDRRGIRYMDNNMMPPPPPYWQYPPQYMNQVQPVINPLTSNNGQTSEASKNIANSSLTLQQIGGITIVLGSLAVSIFSAWVNLTKEIDTQKNNFIQFKEQIARDVSIMDKTIQELKTLNSQMHNDDKTQIETLDKRIQDLDATVSQIYQKVSNRQ